MQFLCSALLLLSAASLGIFTGAMLTELFVLVPWWRTLSPAEFFAWYAANDQRLLGYFGPVTTATAIVTLAAAVVAVWTGQPGRWLAAGASGIVLLTVAMFFVYFEAANASFSAASIPAADLAAELARWGYWHAVRTAACVVALGCAMLALPRAA